MPAKDIFRFSTYVLLSYIAVSYVVICVYVAPPFGVIGEVVEDRDFLFILDWLWAAVVLSFIGLLVFALLRMDSPFKAMAVFYSWLFLILANLTLVVCGFAASYLASTPADRELAEAYATGVLGFGWFILICMMRAATREQESAETNHEIVSQEAETGESENDAPSPAAG